VYKLIPCSFAKILLSIKGFFRSNPSHGLIRQVSFLFELNFYPMDAAVSRLQIPEIVQTVLCL